MNNDQIISAYKAEIELQLLRIEDVRDGSVRIQKVLPDGTYSPMDIEAETNHAQGIIDRLLTAIAMAEGRTA